MPQLVIKDHRPWQQAIAIITLSAAVALLTWLLLDNTHWKLIYDRSSGNLDVKGLLEANQALTQENRELNGKVMMLEQTTRLDKETAILMQEDLKSLQDEIYGLKRELEFYQGVMDAARKIADLDIHGLFVEQLTRQNQYRMKLVLTHVAKSDKVLKGRLIIDIEGTAGGGKQRLAVDKLAIGEAANLAFELKNFKRMEYEFELPPEFSAERVLVQVSTTDRGAPGMTRIFDWPLN